jgi:hypothetical protein
VKTSVQFDCTCGEQLSVRVEVRAVTGDWRAIDDVTCPECKTSHRAAELSERSDLDEQVHYELEEARRGEWTPADQY